LTYWQGLLRASHVVLESASNSLLELEKQSICYLFVRHRQGKTRTTLEQIRENKARRDEWVRADMLPTKARQEWERDLAWLHHGVYPFTELEKTKKEENCLGETLKCMMRRGHTWNFVKDKLVLAKSLCYRHYPSPPYTEEQLFHVYQLRKAEQTRKNLYRNHYMKRGATVEQISQERNGGELHFQPGDELRAVEHKTYEIVLELCKLVGIKNPIDTSTVIHSRAFLDTEKRKQIQLLLQRLSRSGEGGRQRGTKRFTVLPVAKLMMRVSTAFKNFCDASWSKFCTRCGDAGFSCEHAKSKKPADADRPRDSTGVQQNLFVYKARPSPKFDFLLPS
jgi:hypothetical protein